MDKTTKNLCGAADNKFKYAMEQKAISIMVADGFLLFLVLFTIYGGYVVYFLLHPCADVWRLKTLALISKAKENIIVIFVFNERKIYNVMLVTIRRKVVI